MERDKQSVSSAKPEQTDLSPSYLNPTQKAVEVERLRQRKVELKTRIENLSKDLKFREVREHALEEFYFFCKNIMGFKDLHEPLHRPLCDFISDATKHRKMVLIPRGCFKTTICSISYPIWLLLRDQEERIGLFSVTGAFAEDILKEIVERVAQPSFQAMFGDLIPSPDKWPVKRQFEARIPRKGKQTGPSLYAAGTESSEVGRHFSTIVVDDMVNDAKVMSPRQREKVWDWFGRLHAVLDPEGQFVVPGTRWHWDDPYSRLATDPDWEKIILSSLDKYGDPVFPSRLPKKKLLKLRSIMGDYRYSCFYENNPSGDGVNPFQLRRISWLDYEEEEPNAWTHILIDPASTTNSWSCPSGFIIGDALPTGSFLVKAALQIKLKPDELIEKVISLASLYKPRRILIETDSANIAYYYWLREKFYKKQSGVSLKDIKNPKNIDRETRTILELQPRIHEGQILFKTGMEGQKELLEEIATFPKGKTNDLIMALALIRGVHYPPAFNKPAVKEQDRRTAIFNQIIAKSLKKGRKKRKIPRMQRKPVWI